ncbi:MAG TPA: endonuclease V [candidate division Zixibacteria bacterium]|nr:endonuclease V [candidate division Zixibacteria bacterium]
MELKRIFDWPQDKDEARRLQSDAASSLTFITDHDEPRLIAAVDTAYGYGGEVLYAAVVVTSFPEIEIVERNYYYGEMTFPYLPGLLFYREGPVILKALAKLQNDPDLIIVHGHGIAHDRGCGQASHIGLAFDKPTIGCARKLLAGRVRAVPEIKGGSQPIIIGNREVGLAYRSKDKVKPIFISPGYRCDLNLARDIVVRNLRGYRLPEPLRLAHLFANKYKRRFEKESALIEKAGELA